jgi:hypothetical protein
MIKSIDMGWVGTRSMRDGKKGLQIAVEELEGVPSLVRSRTSWENNKFRVLETQEAPGGTGFTWFRLRLKL